MPFPVVDNLRSIEFGTPGVSRAHLNDLVLHAHKRATATTLAEYEREGETLEKVGECLSMLDDDGSHLATLRVRRVDVCRFADVPDEFALAEGEGDLNGDDFRASHLEYWNRVGEPVDDDTPIVQIYFDPLPVRLRPLVDADAEWIHRACQDQDIQRWTQVPRPYTIDHARSFVHDRAGEKHAFVIVDHATDEPIGMTGIHTVVDATATIGYWVAPWARQRGAATGAVAIISWLACRLEHATRVIAHVADDNRASRRALENAGFTNLGTLGNTAVDNQEQIPALTYSLSW